MSHRTLPTLYISAEIETDIRMDEQSKTNLQSIFVTMERLLFIAEEMTIRYIRPAGLQQRREKVKL